MARFRRRQIVISQEKHADTKIHTIGPATASVANHIMRDTEVGDRDPAGADDTIQLGRGLGNECNIGDTCKYMNIHIEAGPRNVSATNGVNNGWIEWGFVIHKGTDAEPANTNLGTMTLGNVLTNYFRNQCIYTGAIPVGGAQPTVAEITLKIPKTMQTLRVGDEWTLYLFARTISATETGTTDFRVITSCNFINKH